MSALKRVNLALSWLLEIAMLAAFAYWGLRTGSSLWLKLLLGIGAPVAVIFLWGVLLAPRSGRRVQSTLGLVLSLALFYLAALALYQAQQPALGAVMLIAAALNRTLAVIWKQW